MAAKGDPPPRRAKRVPGRKIRQPRIKADEKAAIDENARKLAKEINGRLDQLGKEVTSKNYSPEERRRRTQRRAERARKARRKNGDPDPICKGFTWNGAPCKLPPLIPENWDGPNEPTGLYCIHHDPNITRDETEAYILHGSPNAPLPRKVTAGELAHILVQRSPQAVLEPYFKALGLELNEDGQLEKARKGLRLHGFSRSGEVVRSPYEDIVGQVNVAEKLLDRVYGKPRQAIDMASQNTTVAVKIDMTVDRVDIVTQVLAQSGALPMNGNGNGQPVIEGHAEDLDDEV